MTLFLCVYFDIILHDIIFFAYFDIILHCTIILLKYFDIILHYIKLFFLFQGASLIQARVSPPSDTSGKEQPIVSFIKLEHYNAIKLVQSIHQSLASLSKIIRGTMLLTSEAQKLAAALLHQEVDIVY